eukprot:829800_1
MAGNKNEATLSQVPWLKNKHVKGSGSHIRFIAILNNGHINSALGSSKDLDESEFCKTLKGKDPEYIEIKYDEEGNIQLPKKKNAHEFYLSIMKKVFSTFPQKGKGKYLHMIFSNGQDHSRYGLETLFSKGGDKVVSAIWTDLEPLATQRTVENLTSENFGSRTSIQDNYLAIMDLDDAKEGLKSSKAFYENDSNAASKFAARVYGNGLKDAGGAIFGTGTLSRDTVNIRKHLYKIANANKKGSDSDFIKDIVLHCRGDTSVRFRSQKDIGVLALSDAELLGLVEHQNVEDGLKKLPLRKFIIEQYFDDYYSVSKKKTKNEFWGSVDKLRDRLALRDFYESNTNTEAIMDSVHEMLYPGVVESKEEEKHNTQTATEKSNMVLFGDAHIDEKIHKSFKEKMDIAWADLHDIVLVDSKDTEGSSSTSQAGLETFDKLLNKMTKIDHEPSVLTFDPFSSVDGKARKTNLEGMFKFTPFAKLLHENNIFRSEADVRLYFDENPRVPDVWTKSVRILGSGDPVASKDVLHSQGVFDVSLSNESTLDHPDEIHNLEEYVLAKIGDKEFPKAVVGLEIRVPNNSNDSVLRWTKKPVTDFLRWFKDVVVIADDETKDSSDYVNGANTLRNVLEKIKQSDSVHPPNLDTGVLCVNSNGGVINRRTLRELCSQHHGQFHNVLNEYGFFRNGDDLVDWFNKNGLANTDQW